MINIVYNCFVILKSKFVKYFYKEEIQDDKQQGNEVKNDINVNVSYDTVNWLQYCYDYGCSIIVKSVPPWILCLFGIVTLGLSYYDYREGNRIKKGFRDEFNNFSRKFEDKFDKIMEKIEKIDSQNNTDQETPISTSNLKRSLNFTTSFSRNKKIDIRISSVRILKQVMDSYQQFYINRDINEDRFQLTHFKSDDKLEPNLPRRDDPWLFKLEDSSSSSLVLSYRYLESFINEGNNHLIRNHLHWIAREFQLRSCKDNDDSEEISIFLKHYIWGVFISLSSRENDQYPNHEGIQGIQDKHPQLKKRNTNDSMITHGEDREKDSRGLGNIPRQDKYYFFPNNWFKVRHLAEQERYIMYLMGDDNESSDTDKDPNSLANLHIISSSREVRFNNSIAVSENSIPNSDTLANTPLPVNGNDFNNTISTITSLNMFESVSYDGDNEDMEI